LLTLNWWQKFPGNSADKQRKNSPAFAEKRILAQPCRANQFDFFDAASLVRPGGPRNRVRLKSNFLNRFKAIPVVRLYRKK
jgi:hypothetical protein